MPCCYQIPPPLKGELKLPAAIQFELGTDLACDIHRTYLLQAVHGYNVDWAAIPKAITPKNRLIIGRPPAQPAAAVLAAVPAAAPAVPPTVPPTVPPAAVAPTVGSRTAATSSGVKPTGCKEQSGSTQQQGPGALWPWLGAVALVLALLAAQSQERGL